MEGLEGLREGDRCPCLSSPTVCRQPSCVLERRGPTTTTSSSNSTIPIDQPLVIDTNIEYAMDWRLFEQEALDEPALAMDWGAFFDQGAQRMEEQQENFGESSVLGSISEGNQGSPTDAMSSCSRVQAAEVAAEEQQPDVVNDMDIFDAIESLEFVDGVPAQCTPAAQVCEASPHTLLHLCTDAQPSTGKQNGGSGNLTFSKISEDLQLALMVDSLLPREKEALISSLTSHQHSVQDGGGSSTLYPPLSPIADCDVGLCFNTCQAIPELHCTRPRGYRVPSDPSSPSSLSAAGVYYSLGNGGSFFHSPCGFLQRGY